jgi:hypothetical protein
MRLSAYSAFAFATSPAGHGVPQLLAPASERCASAST